jgi:hypothetical protein
LDWKGTAKDRNRQARCGLFFQQMNENLMTIVLETLAFFELAGDDLVEPDSAVEQMEGAAHFLAQLSAEEKKQFADFARRYADDEANVKGTAERVEFFRSVPQHFDLER